MAAIIIGCAQAVWKEVAEAEAMLGRPFDAVYCVKHAGIFWQGGRFTWVTLHPEYMDDYEAKRAALGAHTDYEIVAPNKNELGQWAEQGRITRRTSYRYPGMERICDSASSSGLACKIATEDGHNRIVLTGSPMDGSGGHFTRGLWLTEAGAPSDPTPFQPVFEKSIPYYQGRIRSMSGWTMEKLGAPTPQWLRSGEI